MTEKIMGTIAGFMFVTFASLFFLVHNAHNMSAVDQATCKLGLNNSLTCTTALILEDISQL